MQSKIILAVVAAICMVQAASASTNFTEIIEKYKEEVEKLWEEVEEKVEDAISKVESSINATASDLLSGWEKEIEKAASKVNASVAVVEACAKNETSLATIAEDIVTDSVSCVLTKYTTPLKEINATVVEILEDAKSAITKIKACEEESGTLKKDLCIAEEVATKVVVIGELVAEVVAEAAALVELVQSWETVLATCAASSLATAGVEAATIVKDIISCVKDSA